MKILITGGAGFIGSHLVDACIDAGHTVCVIDNFSTGSADNLALHKNNNRLMMCEADICDRDRVMDIFHTFGPEVVFHLAAQINVRVSIKHPALDAQINVVGTLHILDAMVAIGCSRIIFSSTGGAMFSHGEPPYNETDLPTPATPYGISKRSVEYFLNFYHMQYGIEPAILRYSNVYGPRQNPLGEAGVISIFLQKIRNQEPPTIYGDGEQTRDFIHVYDVVAANLHALNEKLVGIYHVGTGIETSVNELWNILAPGSSLVPVHVAALGEIQRNSLDSTKLQSTGWKPEQDLHSSMLG